MAEKVRRVYVLTRVLNPDDEEKAKVDLLGFHENLDRNLVDEEAARLQEKGYALLGKLLVLGGYGVLLEGQDGQVAVSLMPVGLVDDEQIHRVLKAPTLNA